MNRKMKQQEAFITLVNKQLEPFGKTYEDVRGVNNWYMKYVVTPEQESDFMKWGVQYLKESLGLSKANAEKEMSWFILQWGLKSTKIVNTAQSIEETQAFINKLKGSK